MVNIGCASRKGRNAVALERSIMNVSHWTRETVAEAGGEPGRSNKPYPPKTARRARLHRIGAERYQDHHWRGGRHRPRAGERIGLSGLTRGRMACGQPQGAIIRSWIFESRTAFSAAAVFQLDGSRINRSMPTHVNVIVSKVLNFLGLILAGTTVASLLIGWSAFLLWLAGEAVVTVVRWL